MKAVFSWGVASALALGLMFSQGAGAQDAAPAAVAPTAPSAAAPAATPGSGQPANFVAPELPKAEDSNAERSRSQPGNNAPFWRGVRQSGEVPGVTNVIGTETGVLVQKFVAYPGSDYTTAGEAWRQVRNKIIIPYGGSLMLVVLVAIALFFVAKGPIGHKHAEGGRKIERFTPFERAAHWLNAIAFVLLAVSGIVMAFGKFFLLPVLGSAIFGTVTFWLKTMHNFVGPLFAVTLVVIILTFIKDNFPKAVDLLWLKKAGGLFTGEEVPSHRFNAGKKGVFWLGVFVLGLAVVASGLVLDQLIPNLLYTRGDMQVAHMIHAFSAALMICVFFGHIYLGTIGMRGAYRAMRTGYVSEEWAREHHALWHEDVKAGKIPAQRSGGKASAKPLPQTREA